MGRGVQRDQGLRRRDEHRATADQTNIAKFWTANVVRQYNAVARDDHRARVLDLAETARLAAMVNVVAADAGIAVMHAKYHYLFWRPVTAIDPTSVTARRLRPDARVRRRQRGDRRADRLAAASRHAEPSRVSVPRTARSPRRWPRSSADIPRHRADQRRHPGFDPDGAAGNLNAVRHFATAGDLRTEVANARMWGGLHYRFSTVAGLQPRPWRSHVRPRARLH